MIDALIQWFHGIGLHADPATVDAVREGAGRAIGHLDTAGLLALAGALGWASGFRLYAVVFLVGAMGAAGWLPLPSGLSMLQQPVVLAASGFMLLVEFFADKIPWVDSVWDSVNSVVRIPGGALLAASVFGGDNASWGVAAGLLGGTLAATSFATKATARAAINTSPEPFSNWLASLLEDGLVVGIVWLATQHPVAFGVALLVMVVLSVLLLIALWKFLQAVLRRLRSFFGGGPSASRPV